ncbi:uncharacterized protein [Callorhinus ursinus]|uniref:uncharacterized protein n=1 Tax=Callorhinus ursinus TaxID=34884 RepID=UPI003CCFF654
MEKYDKLTGVKGRQCSLKQSEKPPSRETLDVPIFFSTGSFLESEPFPVTPWGESVVAAPDQATFWKKEEGVTAIEVTQWPAVRPDLAGRGPEGADRSTALTTAARRAAAASRAAQDSRPTPSSNLAAAPKRRRRASPGVSAALNNGRRGRALRRRARATAAAARRLRAVRFQGPQSRRPGPGGCGGARRPRLPAAGAASEGPRSLGACHQYKSTGEIQVVADRLMLLKSPFPALFCFHEHHL